MLPELGTPTVPAMENGRLVDGDLLNLPPGANGIPPRNPLQQAPRQQPMQQMQPMQPMQPLQPMQPMQPPVEPQPGLPRNPTQ